MRPVSLLATLVASAILLSACFGGTERIPTSTAGTSVSPAPSVAPSTSPPEPSAQPSAGSSAPATTEPIPSADLGAFSCDLPIVEDASVGVANITDVRVGTHAGYDRVVFEFQQGTPELTLDRATPPFTEDASGRPMEVDGSSFLRLTMRGGTKQTEEGTSSYEGSTDFSVSQPSLVHLVEGGDFERQSTWYLGLGADACVRVLMLEEPARLVIDVEHP